MHPTRELPKVGNDGIVTGIKIAVGSRGIGSNQCSAAEHCQTDPAFGLFLVIKLIAFFGKSALRIGRLVACRHHPVFELEVL